MVTGMSHGSGTAHTQLNYQRHTYVANTEGQIPDRKDSTIMRYEHDMVMAGVDLISSQGIGMKTKEHKNK